MKKNKKCDYKTVRVLPGSWKEPAQNKRSGSQSFTVNPKMRVELLSSYYRGGN